MECATLMDVTEIKEYTPACTTSQCMHVKCIGLPHLETVDTVYEPVGVRKQPQ